MNGRKLAKFYSRGAERMSAQKYTDKGRRHMQAYCVKGLVEERDTFQDQFLLICE